MRKVTVHTPGGTKSAPATKHPAAPEPPAAVDEEAASRRVAPHAEDLEAIREAATSALCDLATLSGTYAEPPDDEQTYFFWSVACYLANIRRAADRALAKDGAS